MPPTMKPLGGEGKIHMFEPSPQRGAPPPSQRGSIMVPANPFRSFTYATLALAMAASGCSDLTGLERELEANRELWESEGPAAYVFDYGVVCYCPPQINRAVTITVDGEGVVSATYVDSGEPVDPFDPEDFPTVDDLFDEIESALAQDPYSLRAEYDAQLGYPTNVFIDFEENIADEEWGFVVSRFVSAPG